MINDSITPNDNAMSVSAPDASVAAQPAIRQLLLIDSRVPEPQAIIVATTPGVKVVMVDASHDGFSLIARALEGQHNVASISVVSHGDAGVLLLGAAPLTAETLGAHRDDLQIIGAALRPGGDILLYGCDVGAGESGAQFVTALAQATGASVAASDNATGRGGDWALEINSGTVHSVPALDARELAHYDYALHTVSVGNVAQLKAAIATASTDGVADSITLLNNITFSAAADAISINVIDGQTLSIVGGGFTLNGNNLTRVLDVTGGKVAISNLTISNGFVTGSGGDIGSGTTGSAGADALGAAIRNAGTLTISNSAITASKAAGGGGGASQTGGGAGAGGGGGGFGSTFGGVGGANPPAPGGAASAGTGGTGGGFILSGSQFLGGKGGTSTGGSGGIYGGYTTGGNGATANNGSISIGGGGGGAGYDRGGGRGGNAVSGIYNAGTLTITGSAITNNIGAGGGGGGGVAAASLNSGNGGNGGNGIGGIWNAGGLVQIDSATNATLATGNAGSGGGGGLVTKAGSVNGTPGTGTTQILTTGGGTTNTNYIPPDTTPPTSTVTVTDTSLIIGETSAVTITFSEVVSGFANADLTVANGTLSAVSTSNNIVFTATLTPTAGVTAGANVIVLNNAGVVDAANNPGVGTTNSNNYTIDTVRPTATLVVSDASLIAGETSAVTITFSEAVSGFSNADLTIANGTLSAVSTTDNIVFTATLTPTDGVTAGANVITLDDTGYVDLAGNTGTGSTGSNNYAIDTARPTATLVVADTSLIAGETSAVTITFSEAVSGFSNADLTIDNGTLTAVSTVDNIVFNATLTPTPDVNDATNVITLNNVGVLDVAGNTGIGSTDSNNYSVDTQPSDVIFTDGFESVGGLHPAIAISDRGTNILANSPTKSGASIVTPAEAWRNTQATASDGSGGQAVMGKHFNMAAAGVAETPLVGQHQVLDDPAPVPMLAFETSVLLAILLACVARRALRALRA
ncbi:MAG: Ig-like domain-containing protein [Dokdonella sp.]